MPREHVSARQRDRLILATLTVVAERGYPSTTVADIVRRAAVSRTTFYQQFDGRESCFLAAYAYAVAHVEAALAEADRAAVDYPLWQLRAAADVDAYLDLLVSHPPLAIVLHQEVIALGAAGMDHRARLLALLASRIAELADYARRADPSLPHVPAELFALYTGGLDELIRDRLRMTGAAGLQELSTPLRRATIALLGGS